jgi:electron transfer flavoprotein beta subunit
LRCDKNGEYDLVIAGKESLDYNGGMVPGMISGILGYNFINSCTSLTVDETAITAVKLMVVKKLSLLRFH